MSDRDPMGSGGDNLEGLRMGAGQTQLWGAPPRRRGGSRLGLAGRRWPGKHVSKATSSVCLIFWLPRATRPQI